MQASNELILPFITAFSLLSFGYVLYHVITSSPSYKLWSGLSDNNALPVILQRLLGVFIFGLLSLLVIVFFLHSSPSEFGTGAPDAYSFLWLAILSAILIPVNYFNSGSPENLEQYPQIRKKEWPMSLLILSALSWIAYLIAYEFLFRGFLLFASIPLLGLWPAILVNTALYSLTHIPKGIKETLSAIPFGILISYLTFQTGTIWLAVLAHIVLALSNEWYSFYYHPEIHLKRSGK
ncbi:MAG: CPBP family intramembrane metalloprotease [Bacteroidales bacterium]|nr:CPBP family intramembrane metalloprotease [Bacteroidales bacterium]MCB9000198.1 CPBP family intramembrane metalloprotease [Bacteroidales bacterium]MCB9013723.1 CPBP family intramembrane metalloprotease [Bacteroidales bacterium]